jgi:acyl dehydratase
VSEVAALPQPDDFGRRYFEDMTVGTRWVSNRRTLTEGDLSSFAGLSGDFNPIHVDEVAAADGPFGRRIVHGVLVMAVATGLRQQMPIFHGTLKAALEFRSWKFLAPVFTGDTVLCVTTVKEQRPTRRPEQGVVVQGIEIVNQDGVTVQSGEIVSLVLTRAEAGT